MNKKRIFSCLVIGFILTFSVIAQDAGGGEQGARDAAASGQDLSGYTTGELIGARDGCGEGEQSTFDALQKEITLRTEKESAAAAEAAAAESDVCDAVKAYQEAQEKINDIKKEYNEKANKMKSISDKIETWKERESMIKEQKKDVREKYEKVCEASDAMSLAYKKLAAIYNEYGEIGDPVKIAEGIFIADYVDFEAKDYLEKFCVTRSYRQGNDFESFGSNWWCSLDSRIIRCVTDDFTELLNVTSEVISVLNQEQALFDAYNEKWPTHPSEQVSQYLETIASERYEVDSAISDFKELVGERNYFIEKNKFVSYGKYRNEDNVKGNSNLLKFLDVDGVEQVFEYKGFGRWENLSEIRKKDLVIYTLDKAKNVLFSNFGDGYKAVYLDGTVKYFSTYGILEKRIDRNGNEEVYISENGKIKHIILKTGEVISVYRNSKGFITDLCGSVSGNSSFIYDGNNLKSVKDASGVVVGFGYDGEGYLTKIQKADGSFVTINYEYSSEKNKKVCSSVVDENANKESFKYISDSEVVHTNFAGRTESYKLNNLGNTVYVCNQEKKETTFSTNSKGLITQQNKNGFIKDFYYNENLQVSLIKYGNGGEENYSYNDYGFVTSHVDADGFTESYDYDSKGNIKAVRFCDNIVTSIEYYPNGLIKNLWEGKRTVSYEYNNFGSVTRRLEKNSDFKWENKEEKWIYDNQNRVTKYILNGNFSIVYDYIKNSNGTYNLRENWNGTKLIERSFDARNREIFTKETDLVNNVCYSKRIVHDGKGFVKQIYFDDILMAAYEYYPDGKLKSYEVWNNCEKKNYELGRQAIKTEFVFNDLGLLSSEIRKSVQNPMDEKNRRFGVFDRNRVLNNCSYSFNNNHTFVKSSNGDYVFLECEYDERDFLVKEKYPDGYCKNYDYSKAGRILKISDSENNCWKYDYRTDGFVFVSKTNGSNIVETYLYDENGLLVTATKGTLEFKYTYDSYGNFVKIKTPKGYTVSDYDVFGRKISEKTYSMESKLIFDSVIEYDDCNLVQKLLVGGEVIKTNKFDVWNRIIEEIGSKGKTQFKYDVNGNCVCKKNQLGTEINYEYTPDGNLSLILLPNGNKVFNQFMPTGELVLNEKNGKVLYDATYRSSGQLTRYKDSFGNETKIEYYSSGVVYAVNNYDSGRTVFNSFVNGNSKFFRVLDNYENKFTVQFDNNGSTVTETNSLGKSAVYQYNSSGLLKNKTNFDGKKSTNTYVVSQGIEQTDFWNGENITIKQNLLGNYESLGHGKNKTEFDYNEKGLLTKTCDEKLKLSVNYEYDSYNRCVRKYNDYFDFSYEYDVLGRLFKASDKKTGFWVLFKYDENSYDENGHYREISRTYSNGNETFYGYNQTGERIYVVTKNKNGNIIKAELVYYDENGRIKSVLNETGKFTFYEYDQKGRLIKSVQPWSENLQKMYEKEAQDCGIFIKNLDDAIQNQNFSLPENEFEFFEKLILKFQLENEIKVADSQKSWIETYSYNKNGSLISLKNQVAQFIYDYDSMNRLICKHGNNSVNRGKKIVWNDEGNLIEINSCLKKLNFTYGALNRPEKMQEYDISTGKETFYQYSYDALGRRVCESKNGEESFGYVYDGLSNNLIFVTPLMNNEEASVNTITGQKNYSYSGDFRMSYDYLKNTFARDNLNGYSEESEFRLVKGDYIPFDADSVSEEFNSYSSSPKIDFRPYAVLSINNKPMEISYLGESQNPDFNSEVLYQNLFGQTVLTWDQYGNEVAQSDFDVWGNAICSGKNQFFCNSAVRLKCENVMFDFGLRDYFPEINSFSTMDPARKGINWFGYSICDPVNYIDEGGLFKLGLTESEEADYAAEISEFIKYDIDEMSQEEEWKGMPLDFNCTEVSSFIDDYVNKKLGLETTSEMEKEFSAFMTDNNTKKAANSVCSKYIYDDDEGKNARRTSDSLGDLKNPDIVTPGTLLVWGPDSKQNINTGHTMTVLARKFDDSGNVVGFTYIEGHLKTSKLTELGYCSVDWSYLTNDISQWRGKYKGTYELDGISSEENKSGNLNNNCTK